MAYTTSYTLRLILTPYINAHVLYLLLISMRMSYALCLEELYVAIAEAAFHMEGYSILIGARRTQSQSSLYPLQEYTFTLVQ